MTVYTDITDINRQEGLLRAPSAVLSGQLLSHAEGLSAANRELAAANAALEETRRELTEMEARTRLATKMMPGSLSEIVGRHVEEALGARNFARIEPGLHRARAGEANVFEITHDSSGRRIRMALTPDHGRDGAVRGVYALSTDVTEEALGACSPWSGREARTGRTAHLRPRA